MCARAGLCLARRLCCPTGEDERRRVLDGMDQRLAIMQDRVDLMLVDSRCLNLAATAP